MEFGIEKIETEDRMYRLLFIFFIVIIYASCTGKGKVSGVQVPRDTSITPAVAFTSLILDSIKVEKYIASDAREKDLVPEIRNFYNTRNYQYAWFDEEGLTEKGEAFWNLHQMQIAEDDDTSVSARRLHDNMELLLNEDTTGFTGENLRNTELDLTLHFFRYLNTVFNTKVSPEQMQWHIPMRKINVLTMLDSFLSGKGSDWKPLNQTFYKLENKVGQFAAIVRAGGWPFINMKKGELKPGEKDPLIVQVKRRLGISGDYNTSDTTIVFTSELEAAIKKMQNGYGLKESGKINTSLIRMLNVPVEERLKQIKINLERWRWLPSIENGIFVNIPEYKLHVFEAGKEVLHMNIIVGKAANRTVIFSDRIEHIIFGPYWNVPRSIVRNEILPAMRRSGNYLARNNMEITGYSNGLPEIRQRPGPGNALGSVKFVFPNRYNIYLHDTPAKTLFSNEKRAFSHGCIRIQNPFELAKYLLRNDKQWTDERIRDEMNRTSEKLVKINPTVPVFVVYFTSWIDADGLLHFRDDVYGHDKRMAGHLFEN